MGLVRLAHERLCFSLALALGSSALGEASGHTMRPPGSPWRGPRVKYQASCQQPELTCGHVTSRLGRRVLRSGQISRWCALVDITTVTRTRVTKAAATGLLNSGPITLCDTLSVHRSKLLSLGKTSDAGMLPSILGPNSRQTPRKMPTA